MLIGKRKVAVAAVLALLAAGCANPSSSRYNTSDVGQIIETSEGTVLSSRIVDIEGGDNAGYGAVAGGAAGGTAGYVSMGNSSATGLVAVLGAIIGAGVGYLAEDSVRSREGIEYLVRLDDGRVVTLVQNREGEEVPMQNGTPVLVQYGNDYTRVVEKPAVLDGMPPGGAAPTGKWQNPDKPSAQPPAASGQGDTAAPFESQEVQ
jgi:outer membrane lipoprotein SlyB